MSKISTYEVAPVPKLSDKLIGTSVGGEIEDVTYNFTLQELLDVFLPVIPANNLQGVLDYGNTATQDINLFGTITTTNLDVTDTANLFITYLNEETHLVGSLFDSADSVGTAGQVLTSTGDGVEWFTLPPIFTPNLQQVLEEGNTANLDIILDANLEALDVSADTATVGVNLTLGGTITDNNSSVGSAGQVLESTVTGVQWTNLPVYSATSPLLFDSGTGVFSIQPANSTQGGYLTANDWVTFDGKQNAGAYITALTGEATATGPGSVPITLNNASVIAKVLTGLNVTGGSISASDSILTAFGKVQSQINGLMGGVQYQGVWNAATNTPTLTSSVGTQGHYYIVNVAGSTDLNGITDWKIGDWAIFSGGTWQKVDNTESVTSVNGQTGAVSLTTDNIPEGATNLYYLDSRARGALSFAAGSGAYNSLTGVITIPTNNNQILNGANYITLASLSATGPLAYNNLTGVFSIQQATALLDGYLSATDWSTFNSKQNYLGGTGLVKSTAGTITYITDNSGNWNTAYNDSIISASVTGTTTKTLTLNQQDGGTIQASWTDLDTGLTSVGVSMPAAFSVANSPLTANGTIAITGAGTTLQYIDGTGALQTFPGLTGFVPYTGANQNVDLGEYGISAGYFQADLTPTGALQVGRMQWNSTDGTMDLRLLGNNVTLQIGEENVSRVVNKSGIDLLEENYQVVRLRKVAEGGAQGQRIAVVLAQGNSENNSTEVLGLVTETINANQEGFITCFGEVKEINTTGSLQGETWVDGDILYLSSTVAGALTNVRPVAPNHSVIVGYVSYAHAIHGKIYMAIDTGYELGELHNVYAPSPTNNQSIYWNSTNSRYQLNTIGGILGYTPANAATLISTTAPLQGGGDLSANRTLSITQAGASTDGYLSSTDWNTFNNKQPAGSYVPTSRLLSINGTQYDLSADRSWSVGTVTSVASLTLGTSGTDLSSSVANGTTTPVITLNVPTASAANRGALSAADWSTFNTKVGGVTASSPLASSGGQTPNITIQQASGSQDGYLSSTDWTTFNNKQAAGNYITSLTGEATASGPGAAAVTLNNASVTAKVLTGVNITGGSISATDSILTAFGKVQNQINGLIGSTIYQGTWNAATNTPALASGVGTRGYYYIVNVAGTTNLDGITDWFVGDWAIFDGTAWQQVDNTDAVVSVNGQTGAVSLTTDNIPEGATNQYFTQSRARASLSFAAGSGAYNSSTGVITIPTNTNQLTNGASFITLASLSGSAPIQYNNTTGVISITQAGTASNGYLSSTDWNTFNNKQGALTLTTTGTSGAATLVGNTLNIPQYQSVITNPVTGTGTTNYLPKFTGTSTIGNSAITDDGTTVTLISRVLQVGSYLNIYSGAYAAQTIPSIRASSANNLILNAASTGTLYLNYETGSGGVYFGNGASGQAAFITSAGAATFSSSVTANSSFTNQIGLVINGNTTGGIRQNFIAQGSSGTYNFQIGTTITTNNAFEIIPSTTTDGTTFSTAVFKILNTGAATFSSSVSTGSDLYVNGNSVIGNSNAGISSAGTTRLTLQNTTLTNSRGIGFYANDGTQNPRSWIKHITANGSQYMEFSSDYSTASSYSNFIFQNGNVLIGTTSDAGYKLDVNGTGRFSGNITGTNDFTLTSTGGHTISMIATSGGSQTIQMTSAGGGSSILSSTGGDFQIRTTDAKPIVFQTNGSENLRIASGGAATFSNLAGTGTRIVVADASGTLSASSALSGYITGSGTTNYIPKFSSASAIGNSSITDTGNGINVESLGSASCAAAGWYKVGVINDRGGGILTLSVTGGSYAPVTYEIKYYKQWTDNGTLQLSQYGANSYITDARIRQDASDSLYYIEIYATSTISFAVYHYKLLGYNATSTVYTGTLTAGSASGTTIAQLPFRAYGLATQGITLTPYNGTSAIAFQRNVGGGTIYNYGSVVNNGSDVLYQGTGAVFINADSDSDSTSPDREVKFGNRGVVYATLNSNGNLGVGTTGPISYITRFIEVSNATSSGIKFTGGTSGLNLGVSLGYITSDKSFRITNYETTGVIRFETQDLTRATVTAAGNFLIGTTTDAGYKLDVNGGIRIQGTILGTSVANNWLQSTQSGVSAQFQTWYASNGTTRRGYFGYGSGGSDNFTLMNEANGQLTIGTNSISALIIASTGAATFSSTVTSKGLIIQGNYSNITSIPDTGVYGTDSAFADGYGGLILASRIDAARPILFGTYNGTSFGERMRITSGGNVLIGTTTSAGAAISLQATSSAYSIWSINDATANYSQFYFGGTASSGYQFIRSDGRSGGWISLGTQDTERMRITSGGNVGINTSSPTQKLHLYIASGAIYTRIENNLNSLYLGLESGGIAQVSSDVSSLKVMANTFTSFETAGSERMRITSGGNVLVGTTTDAGYKLDVNGNTRVSGNIIANGGSATEVTVYNSSSIRAKMSMTGNEGDLSLYGSSANKTVYLSAYYDSYFIANGATAKLGIGTTSPFSLLHVGTRPGAGTTNPSLGSIATISNDGLTGIDLAANVNANNVVGHINWVNYLGVGNYNTARIDVYADGASNSGSLRFWTASASSSPTERMRITSGGNVGIGTTSPNYLLDVKKDLNGSTSINIENQWGTSNASANLFLTSLNVAGTSTATATLEKYKNGSFYISNNESNSAAFTAFVVGVSERMRITSGGNLLVGTTTDSGYKLDVNGSGMRLKNSGGSADFLLDRGSTSAGATYQYLTGGTLKWYTGLRGLANDNFYIFNNATSTNTLILDSSTNAATFSSSVTATSFFESSDSRLKQLIQDDYKALGIESVKARLYIKDGKEEIGYFAQDFESILPSAISKNDAGFLSLSYTQVHTAKIAIIEDEVDVLKKEVAELKVKLQKYEA